MYLVSATCNEGLGSDGYEVNDVCVENPDTCLALKHLCAPAAAMKSASLSVTYKGDVNKSYCVFRDLTLIDSLALYEEHFARRVRR